MMSSVQIRQEFLDFFKSKGHEIVPSAPIVVKNDPTLLFTNAGMNQFKDYFLGNKKPQYRRVADTQKCLRVSGKHNDLEEVGVDTYHHTMFEMLGNWSFGDYFKKEAIAWSWELLTKVYKLPEDRLYVTVFEGDKSENLPADEEAMNEWKKWIPAERILMGTKKDNFWEMGDTGPCGPCTEIHVDCRTDDERKQVAGKELVNNDHPQVIEIWNNVFIQFNRLKDGSLESLPEKHVDTGMGLERLVRVIQQKTSNYDTDIFTGTIAETEKLVGIAYNGSDNKTDIAFRVIADHIRAICFTIADGQLPSNTGAGYVIRRILRRAVRYYYSYLNYQQPLLYQLVPHLAKQFSHVFPELASQSEFVSRVIKEEEQSFLKTIDAGLKRFNQYIQLSSNGEEEKSADSFAKYLSSRKSKTIAGEFAFELNDTFGFPIDLTQLMSREAGWTVDMKGFDTFLQEQKNRSRSATALDTGDWINLQDDQQPEFVGYDSAETQSQVVKYRKVKSKSGEAYQIVLDKTPFYAESGGQVGDTGVLLFNGESIPVNDTKKENDLIIHFTQKLPSDIGGQVTARIDNERRRKIAIHHSATHLLHSALRKVLGTHVAQKGSLVNADELRFDFSHFAKMTDDEIKQVQQLVNAKVRENIPVAIKTMKKEEAMQLGAMALFGEKYGDMVRVVVMDPQYSIELCGGTHVGSTGELGYFCITHETAVAAGVRRIEALSGKAAEEYVDEQEAMLNKIKESLKNPKEPIKAIENLINENSELKKKLEQVENRMLADIRESLLKTGEAVNGTTFIGRLVEVSSADSLKKLGFDIRNNASEQVTILASTINGKPSVVLALSDNVVNAGKLDAGKIIKEHIAPLIKGGGGGQKNLATAGGQGGNLQDVIQKVKSLL